MPRFPFRALAAVLLCLAAAGCIGDGGGSETEQISGKVTLPDGSWAPRANVGIRPAGYLSELPERSVPGKLTLKANAAGLFKVSGLPPGDYVVEMSHGALASLARITVSKGNPISLVSKLDTPGTVRVHIQDAGQGPAPFLQIYGLERRATLQGNEYLEVRIPPGEYRLRVGAGESPGTAVHFSRVLARSGKDTVAGSLPLAALASRPPVPVIFDANPGVSADDAGALAVLHALADLGEARILAVGSSVPSRAAAASLDILGTWYARGGPPVGAWKGGKPVGGTAWDSVLAAAFPHDVPAWEKVASAAGEYRGALAGQPDSSVVLVVTGPLHNVWTLLRADRDLAARKVKELVIVGGAYPSGKEFNFSSGSARDTLPNLTAEVAGAWPGPVTYLGSEAGAGLLAGGCLEAAPADSPVRKAYEATLADPGAGAVAIDLAAVHYAVRGAGTRWTRVQGRNEVAEDGSNQWISGASLQGHLVRQATLPDLNAELDSLLCRPPKR